ncbi:Utp14 protein-domain-containing protein [Xylaria intraflava]|nr:Utp14 protein-domain-containing protein [Xylaria intraflava]
MPGRQAHGRPLIAAGGGGGKGKNRRSKAKSNSKALNAYAAAQAEVGEQQKRTPRNRQLDADLNDGVPRGKHARDDEDDGDSDDGDGARPRKMRRRAQRDGDEDANVEYGSDSSGNSWRVGVIDEDDDSEIDSDEAFGESDEERFEDFRFTGGKKAKTNKNKKQVDEDEDDSDEDDDIGDADGASLGSDAIDLADALDMSMSEDDEQPGDAQDEDEDGDDSDTDGESSGNESSDVESDDEDHLEDANIDAWVSQFGGDGDTKEAEAPTTSSKPKVGLKELGLLSVKDSELKKSLKLMTKDERATKKQKLEVPLAHRAQAKLDRTVAYDKTNETLGRWLDTVKAMRRTDASLVFPLPQQETGLARHDNSEIAPLTAKTAGTELETTIMAIMEESGLSLSTKPKEKPVVVDEEGQAISRKAMIQQKRRERELQSREEARAKRIKKIKSKAYHRVHRKQKERDEMKEREIMAASGELDSEEEREALDRQRAMERMGARHRESKWAKQANRNGRAAWDEDVRVGVTDMARRDEELRRRIEGKATNGGPDDDSDDSDGSGDSDGSNTDDRVKLLRQLKKLDATKDSGPRSKLMDMDFMKKAEARRKKENDELIADIRRELASDAEDQSESDNGPEDIGRRTFGQPIDRKLAAKANKPKKEEKTDEPPANTNNAQESSISRSKVLSASAPQDYDINGTAGAWSQPTTSGSSKKRAGKKAGPSTDVLDFDIDSVAVSAQPEASAPAKTKRQQRNVTAQAEEDSDDEDQHMPVQFREQELIERAFGGLDVFEAEFQAEKDAAVAEDDEKTVETTLPGWGSWVGEGVTKREKNQRRFFTKKDGVKPAARKDFQNDRAIINEKRVKKNNKYLASQLPHQYEGRAQYERSLRLPIGPEFLTKQSFQDATKPRVIFKQGIIAPIAKPTH